MPVNLETIAPRVFGSFDFLQAAALAVSGVGAVASIAGELPAPLGFTVAAGGLAFAVLEVDGLPLRRLAPRLARYVARIATERRFRVDDPLWSVPAAPRGVRTPERHGVRGAAP